MSLDDENAPVFEPVEDGFDPDDLEDHEDGKDDEDDEGPEDGI